MTHPTCNPGPAGEHPHVHRSPKVHRDPPTRRGAALEADLRAMADGLPEGMRDAFLEGFDGPLVEPEPLPDELASAWRSCLVRAGLLALALILVGLAAAQLARAT